MKIASLTPKQWASGQLVHIKPKLRGWLHLGAAPLSLAASIVLVCLAPTTPTKIGSAVYLACSLILFGVSATYHRFYWAPRWETAWKRMDHSNIFLLIAGTYTPLTIALLNRSACSGPPRRAGSPPSSTSRSDGWPSGTCPSYGPGADPPSSGSSSLAASSTRWALSSTA